MAEALASTYKRYKAGTQKLVSWLSRSASYCEPGPTRAGTGRRRLATNDLVEFAERITNSKDPVIDIPIDILDIAKDAITGRTAATKFYAALAAASGGSSALEEANTSHAHFLAVLQHIFDILKKEHKSRRPKRKKKMPELPTDVNDLTNLYRHLDLEDPSDDIDDVSQQVPFDMKTPAAQHDPVLDDEEEAKSFAIFCLFQDLSHIREQIKDVWRQSENGEITLMTAMRLTEQSMCIVTDLTVQFELDHLELGSLDNILAHLGATDVLAKPILRPQKHHDGDERTKQADEPSPSTPSVFGLQAWQALEAFDAAREQTEPSAESAETKPTNSRHQESEFSKLLMQAFSGLMILVPNIQQLARLPEIEKLFDHVNLPLDVFTCQFLRYIASGEKRLALLACTELFMVVHDSMGSNMSRCLYEAEAVIIRVQENEREHRDRLSKPGQKFTDPILIRQQRYEQEGWVLNSGHFLVEQEGRFVPSSLLRAFPLLPMVNAYMYLFTKHSGSNYQFDFSPTILATAHLYHAWKIIGAMTQPWTDMEFFVAAQNARHGFARLSETSIRSIVNSFGLALGLNLKTVLSNTEPRLPTPEQVRVSATKCLPLCRFSAVKMKMHSKDSDDITDTPLRILYQVVKNHAEQIQDLAIKEQFKATRKLTPVQLLQVLQQFIVEDEPYLHFDTMKFTRICCDWLAQAIIEKRGVSFLFSKTQTPEAYQMVHSMLWNASSAEANGISIKKTLLYRAGVVADREMKTPRDECMRACLECCSRRVEEEPGSTTGDQDHAGDSRSQGDPIGTGSVA